MQTPNHLLVPQLLLLLILSGDSLYGQDQNDTQKPVLDVSVENPAATITKATSNAPELNDLVNTNTNTSSDPATQAAQLNSMEQRIFKIEVIGTVATLIISLFGIALGIGLWNWVTRFVNVQAEQRLSERLEAIEREWDGKFDQMIDGVHKDIECRLNHVMKWAEKASSVETLRHGRRFSEALDICPWNGKVESLEDYPRGLQRTLLACAGRLRDHELGGKGQYLRSQSWIAAKSIADLTDPSDVTFVLREALQHCNYSEGVEYYESAIDSGVTLSDDCHRLACVLLRSNGRNQEALSLAKKYSAGAGIRHLNTLASLMRDDGDLNGAYNLLNREVRQELALPIVSRSKGWHRAVTTFITICYDQNEALKAVGAANDLLKDMPNGIGLYVCCLLARRCPEGEEKERLFDRIEQLLGETPHDQAILARAIVKGHRESSEASVEFLQQAIQREEKKLDLNINSSRLPVIRADIDRYKTEVAYQFLHAEKYGDCKAILMELNEEDKFGDAKYCLAQACIALGQDREALSCIKAACRTKRKWLTCILKNPRFANSELIQTWLRDQMINGSSE